MESARTQRHAAEAKKKSEKKLSAKSRYPRNKKSAKGESRDDSDTRSRGGASQGKAEDLKRIEQQITNKNYFNCGKKGHWMRNCPEDTDDGEDMDDDMSMMTTADSK